MSKPKVKTKEIFTVNKCSLKNICSDAEMITKINLYVSIVNKVVIHTYQFLNFYFRHLSSQNIPLPHVDPVFLRAIVNLVTSHKATQGRPPNDTSLTFTRQMEPFYNIYRQSCTIDTDIQGYEKLSYIMAYELITIITCIETNIKEHFTDSINKPLVSKPEYHSWILQHKPHILYKDSYEKKSVAYDLTVHPQSYLPAMFYINRQLAQLPDVKLFHVIPQRKKIVPSYITLDTAALLNLTMVKGINQALKTVKRDAPIIWPNHFDMTYKAFKHNTYNFHYMIKTNGVACSIMFSKKIKVIIETPYETIESDEPIKSLDYIEKIAITPEMRTKKIVTVDPGTCDLIYCISENKTNDRKNVGEPEDLSKSYTTFRYTQNQRKHEMRTKKYRKIRNALDEVTIIKDNENVTDIHTQLSSMDSKTCDEDAYLTYCRKKNDVNRLLFDHYNTSMYRKLRWNTFMNMQRSESMMINHFQEKFGKPEDVLLVIGDYDKKSSHIAGKEPTICRKIRTLFKRHHYEPLKVNEFRTSKLCHGCHAECKQHKQASGRSVWGLVHCTNGNCNLLHNRDKNAALNMLHIVETVLKGEARPEAFCRKPAASHDTV